jgi:hypothetical protein
MKFLKAIVRQGIFLSKASFEYYISKARDVSPNNGAKNVIAHIVVWENPNPSNKCETQLGITIIVTSIDIPLVLVMDKSNTMEASRVTLGGLQEKIQGEE